jgi:hypothetical protein
MKLQVHYKKSDSEPIEPRCYKLTKTAFLKHFVCAGHKSITSWRKIWEGLGAYLYFHEYITSHAFKTDKFSLPSGDYDYMKQSHFSGCAGLAIADFLAKCIDHRMYSVFYEAAMKAKGMSITGGRPDLLAFTKDASFAIEAKGYKDKCGKKKMEEHKNQSQKGGIPVRFSVACVSYNIYKKIKCNYYDPIDNNAPFDEELFKKLTKEYYNEFIEFLNIGYSTFEYEGEKFYEIKISDIIKQPSDKNPIKFDASSCEILEKHQPKLILPQDIENYAKDGMPPDWKPIKYDDNNENFYIDNDRIGLKIT